MDAHSVLGNQISNQQNLNNALPQGKFEYADDWILVLRSTSLDDTEEILTGDISSMGKYLLNWRLQSNASKTEVPTPHLDNKQANIPLNFAFENTQLYHSKISKFLGATLDRPLSSKKHLLKLADKIKTGKLSGTTWAHQYLPSPFLHLGFVNSTAKNCAPV